MDQYMTNDPVMSEQFEEKIEELYPDSYRRLYPFVQDVVDTVDDRALHSMTQTEVSSLADQVVARSGVTGKQSPGGGLLRDFTQVLLLRELFDRFDGRRFPHYPYRRRRRFRRGRFGRY